MKYFSILILIFSIFEFTGDCSANGDEDLFKINISFKKQVILQNDRQHDVNLKIGYSYSLLDSTNLPSKKKSLKPSKPQTSLHPWRLALLGSGMAIGWLGLHIYYTHTWWKDRAHYFKFAEDPWYARNVDKVSHVYTAAVITEGTGILFEWTGIKPMNALIYGAITATVYETYIEMFDGISPIWGFDWADVAANTIGAIYPIAQKLAPVLNNFNLKWSFKPAWIINKTKNSPDLLNDYTSMTFWLSVSPKGLLPRKIAEYFPGFLAIALGVSLKNASHETSTLNEYRELFIALDYDITKLPGDTDFLKKLKKILNYYHFPSPAVRVSPSGVWYGIYF